MKIRTELVQDHAVVQAINEAAFETPAEAKLVSSLRQQANPVISLVAEIGSTVVGHIMFSPLALEGHPKAKLMGLAPMAVLPAFQRQGIGTALVQEGLKVCAQMEVGAVIVLGHPDFYPRFGFVPASVYSIGCEYDVPDDVFMAVELIPSYLKDLSGKVRYHEAFNDV